MNTVQYYNTVCTAQCTTQWSEVVSSQILEVYWQVVIMQLNKDHDDKYIILKIISRSLLYMYISSIPVTDHVHVYLYLLCNFSYQTANISIYLSLHFFYPFLGLILFLTFMSSQTI